MHCCRLQSISPFCSIRPVPPSQRVLCGSWSRPHASWDFNHRLEASTDRISTKLLRLGQATRRRARDRSRHVYREFTEAGGLVRYGSDETEYYRLVEVYAGVILKGDKSVDLPVQQSIKVELIINLKTARTFGIAVPLSLSGRADELIE